MIMTHVFNQSEKIAILRIFMDLISKDGQIDEMELNLISVLGKIADFDHEYLTKAGNTRLEECREILNGMSESKKRMLSELIGNTQIERAFVSLQNPAVPV